MGSTLLFEQLGIALLLGLLVGLQREHVESGLGGLRTFPLITVLGTVAALLADSFGGWIVGAGLIGIAALVGVANFIRRNETLGGLTTEMAILMMYAVGAYVVVGPLAVAVAIGTGTAVLLHFKPQLHGFASKLEDEDVRAIMQFALISGVVLPVLPNETYGPFNVFNPFNAWLMVVLIVGISLTGYIVYKFLGTNAGILAGGVLGGIISSTATTVSYARRVANASGNALTVAIVIQLASTVVYFRVLVEISAVATGFLPVAMPPLLIMAVLTAIPALVLWLFVQRGNGRMPEQKNPSELKAALVFGAIYVLVLFGLAAAKHWLGGKGLYLVAGLSGLTDMDAITLSTSRMVSRDEIEMSLGWRLIVVATIANLIFKAGLAAMVGNRRLFFQVLLMFSLPIAGGTALLFLWPSDWTLTLPAVLTGAAETQDT